MTALFINTRPKDKGNILLPITTVHLPLLAIRHFDELSEQEGRYLSDFIKGRFTTLIVVSVEAASCAIRFLKKHHLHHAHDLPHHDTLTIIAVGQPTAKTLRDFGFRVITPSDSGHEMSNEGMLSMPIINQLCAGDDVLIWRGVGGRRLLFDTLIARGVNVRAIAFYERCVPMDLKDNFSRLLNGDIIDKASSSDSSAAFESKILYPVFVLITSQMSLQAWQSVYDAWVVNEHSQLTNSTANKHRTHKPTTLNASDAKMLPPQHTPTDLKHGFLPQNMIYLALGKRLGVLTATHYPDSHVQVVADLTQESLSQAVQKIMADVTYAKHIGSSYHRNFEPSHTCHVKHQ